MTFWELAEEEGPGPLDPARAGRALRECHDALLGFPGSLPEYEALTEVERLVELLAADGFLDAREASLLRTEATDVRCRIDRS